MSVFRYDRAPRENFIAYAKRKNFIIAKDLQVKDYQGRRINHKATIESYEHMMHSIGTGEITIDDLRDIKRLIELHKEKGMGANNYIPKQLEDELCELNNKFKNALSSARRRVLNYLYELPAYFVKELEKFHFGEGGMADVEEADAKKEEMEWIQAEIKILQAKLRELEGEVG